MAKKTTQKKTVAKVETTLIKLDLACGDRKNEGFLGIDKYKTESTDALADLMLYPFHFDTKIHSDCKELETGLFTLPDDSVETIVCNHFFEHIPGLKRPGFMDECYRILKKGGQLIIAVPHYNSMRAIQDFTHEWPPVAETSFLYFNKGWREQNKLTHGLYDIKSDFDFGYGFSLDGDVQVRNQEYQQFAVKHYTNAAADLHVTLTKR